MDGIFDSSTDDSSTFSFHSDVQEDTATPEPAAQVDAVTPAEEGTASPGAAPALDPKAQPTPAEVPAPTPAETPAAAPEDPAPVEVAPPAESDDWGYLSAHRDNARRIVQALVEGDTAGLEDALKAVAPTPFSRFAQAQADAKAASTLAAKYGLSEETVVARLTTGEAAVKLSRDVEAALGALPEAQAAKLRGVLEAAEAVTKERDEARAQVAKFHEADAEREVETATEQFKATYSEMISSAARDIVGPRDAALSRSIVVAAYDRYLTVPARDFRGQPVMGEDGRPLTEYQRTVERIEESVYNKEPEATRTALYEKLNRLYRQELREELRLRSLEPATPEKADPPKGTKPAAAAPKQTASTVVVRKTLAECETQEEIAAYVEAVWATQKASA